VKLSTFAGSMSMLLDGDSTTIMARLLGGCVST
jgi:hypothetical protein